MLYRTLERFPGQVTWRRARARAARSRSAALGSGSTVDRVPAPGKLPLHLEGRGARRRPRTTSGCVIRDARTRPTLAYFSGVAGPSPEVERALADADVVFFDGTFWSSDELIAAGPRHATRRGDGALADRRTGWEPGISVRGRARRAIYIHINNTNPILREDSPERRAVDRAGIEIAHDGMELDAVSEPRAARCSRRRVRRAAARGRGAPLSRPAPVPPADARGQADARRSSQAWTLNRYYYQTRIPIKDAIIVSKSEDPAFRRAWIRRIHDHDGDSADDGRPGAVAAARRGGRARPRRGGELPARAAGRALRLRRATCTLCRESPLVVAVASSLTEMFAPDLMSARIAAWEQHYPVGRRRGARLLPVARPARAARRRGGAGVRGRERDVARAAGGLRGGAGAQDGDPVAPASTASRRRPGRRSRDAMIARRRARRAWRRKARLRVDRALGQARCCSIPNAGSS